MWFKRSMLTRRPDLYCYSLAGMELARLTCGLQEHRNFAFGLNKLFFSSGDRIGYNSVFSPFTNRVKPMYWKTFFAVALVVLFAWPANAQQEKNPQAQEEGKADAKKQDDQGEIKIAGAVGSETNPIRCHEPNGERAYLGRLIDENGDRIKTLARFSTDLSPYGNIMDVYMYENADGERKSVYMDMYHPDFVDNRPVPGFRIRSEYSDEFVIEGNKYKKIDGEEWYTGSVVEKYKNGKPSAKFELKNGVIVDSVTLFYESGETLKTIPYNKSNQKHGKLKWLRENKKVWAEYNYLDDVITEKVIYHENEKIQFKSKYKNGMPHGTAEEFYENGQTKSSTAYVNGKMHGVRKEFSEQGKLIKSEEYKDGEKMDKPEDPV